MAETATTVENETQEDVIICPYCCEPVLPGQATANGGKWHYRCHMNDLYDGDGDD